MYSDVFCRVYNEFGWNYYPEAFAEQLLRWLEETGFTPKTSLGLACGTGILCQILHSRGIVASGMDLSPGMIEIARASNPQIPYEVADMVAYRPEKRFDLVTCTGDALNHIPELEDLGTIFANVCHCLNDGGWLVFDLLDEKEVSDSEPFEMDFDQRTRVWFQMTRPTDRTVHLKIRVYEEGFLQFEETIRETIHDPEVICGMLKYAGFRRVTCTHRLSADQGQSTTWYLTAQK